MTVTEIAIKRPTLVVVFFSVLGILGLIGYKQLKYDLIPKVNPPFVTIITAYPGASPGEVEANVTKPIEDAVSGMDKVSAVRSTSYEGMSLITIEFTQSADVNIALQESQRKVNGVSGVFPKDVRQPVVQKLALDEIPVLRLGLTSSLPSREFYQLVKDQIQARIAKIEGVGQIALVGGEERQIQINMDAQKLKAYNLSLLQVSQMIKASNVEFPAGKIKDADGQFVVRLAGKVSTLDDLRHLIVGRSRQGGEIQLADVAEVQDGTKEVNNITRVNGVTSIGMLVSKGAEANSVDVSKKVRDEIHDIEKDYANRGLRFTIAADGSQFTIDAANAVQFDLMLAVLLVGVVMLLFLHSLRSSFIVMVAIPASLIGSIAGMWAFGFSFNLMTLLGMSLVIGILVDDSIVVLENIYHHLEKGKDKFTAALDGRNEIGFAALSITMVDVVVFLPLAVLPGFIGNILREFSVVVLVATLLSLVVSFTVTPALAARIATIEKLTRGSLMGRFALWFENLFKRITSVYEKVLRWSLTHRWQTVVITIVLFFASIALLPLGFIGTEFMPQPDRGEFSVTIELAPGAKLEQTNQATLQLEQFIRKIPEVRRVFVNVGASNEGLIGQSANNAAEINVALASLQERTRSSDEVSLDIKNYAKNSFPGAKVRVNPIGIFGVGNQTPIQMIVRGNSFTEVAKAAKLIADVARSVPGTADVRLSAEDGKPETRIELDRQKMSQLGLTVSDIGLTLRTAFAGDDDSKFRDGNTDYPIMIRLDEADRSKTDLLGALTVVNNRGQQIELQQFATIYQSVGPSKLQRENRNSAVTVFSQVNGRPSGTVVAEIQKALEGKLPQGITINYGGDTKNQQESFQNMSIALIVAILFVYLVMVALYDSYIYPFVVLFSIPVALVGALLAMALANKALGMFSAIGIIMLVGLVTKNAILLVDRANQMRKEHGLSAFDALLEAGESRLRPIVMTTIAMVIGMMPIALSSSAGAEWKTGLAWALIGGLTSSMFLTLVLVPVVYIKMDDWKNRLPAFMKRLVKFGKKTKTTGEAQPVPDGVATARSFGGAEQARA